MSTATTVQSNNLLGYNEVLFSAIISSVQNALAMCETKAKCVGVSLVPTSESGKVTGMIGVHGKVSGFVTMNMAERFAIRSVEGLLDTQYGELTPQVVDGTGEITNIIVGGIKSSLAKTPWAFSNITVPSVILGKGYSIAYAKGLEFLHVSFEHLDDSAVMLEDRLFHVDISLLNL